MNFLDYLILLYLLMYYAMIFSNFCSKVFLKLKVFRFAERLFKNAFPEFVEKRFNC